MTASNSDLVIKACRGFRKAVDVGEDADEEELPSPLHVSLFGD